MTELSAALRNSDPEVTAPPTDSVELAYTRIRDRILAGQLRAGSVVSQVQLARELQISRTPLREALRQLGSEGLVIIDFNRRVRISELDLDDFDEIYAMRLALEPLGVTTTVPRLSDDQKEELSHHVRTMARAIEDRDLQLFRVNHRAFHLGLVGKSGWRMHQTITELWDHSERYRLAYLHLDRNQDDILSHERFRLSQIEHEQILESAVAGHAAECSGRLVAHLQRTVEGVYQQAPPNHIPAMSRLVAGAFHGRNPR